MMSYRFLATAAVAALCLAAAPALAQETSTKPPAATNQKKTVKPQGSKPAVPAVAETPAPAAEKVPVLEGATSPTPSPTQPDWVKQCQVIQQTSKQACQVSRSLRGESGQTLMTVVLLQVEADKKQLLRLVLPTGTLIPNGTGIYLDGKLFKSGKFVACFPEACLVELLIEEPELKTLISAKQMQIAVKTPAQSLALPLSMEGFGKAVNGPPIDPKQVALEQQKLQEQLQQAAERARKQLNAPAPAPGATPATPAQ